MNYIILLKNLAYSAYPYLVLASIGYENISKALTTLVSILGGGVALLGLLELWKAERRHYQSHWRSWNYCSWQYVNTCHI